MNKKQKNTHILLINLIGLMLFCIIPAGFAQGMSAVVQATTPIQENTQRQQAISARTTQAMAKKKQKVTAELKKANKTTDDLGDEPKPMQDPFEKINRPIFQFNELVDAHIAKPSAAFYNFIMPRPLNQGIHNFFNNMTELPTIANDVLQLNIYQTLNDAWRFLINSTLGIAGFFDVATHLGLPYYANDFGLTLAFWGYTDSTFIVLPFWGPRTIRDGIIGLPVDYYAFSLYPHIYPISSRYALYALSVIDSRAQLLQFQPVFEAAAIDKYVFLRNAYMQRRAFQIKEGQIWGPKQRVEIPVATAGG